MYKGIYLIKTEMNRLKKNPLNAVRVCVFGVGFLIRSKIAKGTPKAKFFVHGRVFFGFLKVKFWSIMF